MNDKLLRQVTGEIGEALREKKLQALSGKKALRDTLRSSEFQQGLASVLPVRERLKCAGILEFCRDIMDRMSGTPEQGWGLFCYQYISSIMYPDSGFAPGAEKYRDGAEFYLTVLQILLDHERAALPFDPMLDFAFLSEEEYAASDTAGEYRRLLEAWRNEHVYELMRLGMEYTPFCTLSHIAGVHYIAMTAARGLVRAGEEVDLALISGAAAAHDLGKFGCRPGERVPYLHYYYTDQWLLARRMEGISHIASNHSVWDLELESLSVESLLLIYADFRSKQSRDAQGREITVFFSLDDAFQVILSKLDNVDAAKKHRYEQVYGRLHDFEDFMISRGVDTELTGTPREPVQEKDPALMSPQEALHSLVLFSVQHNIRLMHMLSSEQKFGNIIEAARSAKSWQQLRAFLNVFEEYFTYLSVRQKTQALSFLYELLVHRDGDIRRQAGALIGQIIAKFHLVYRKEVPADASSDPAEEVPFTLWEEYLDRIIFPDYRTTPQQKAHIGYTLKLMVGSMLQHARPGDIPRFLDALFARCRHPENLDADAAFCLLDAIGYLPPQHYGEEVRGMLIEFAAHYAVSADMRLCTAALEFFQEAQRSLPGGHPQMRRIVQVVKGVSTEPLTSLYLVCRILHRAGEDTRELEERLYREDITGEVFLDDLKTATPWAVKVAGIELLRDQVIHGVKDHILHIATHFSNLVKVSERVVVRQTAGAALVRILPLLRREQRNEVVVELGKGLEIGQYQISRYIPEYLGEAVLYLHPSELDEQVLWLRSLLGSASDSAASGALNTVAVLLQHYPAYRARFAQSEESYEKRREVLAGMLLQGLAHYREAVRQEALLVIGKMLFGSSALDMEEKARLFGMFCRKLLFLIREAPQTEALTFFYRAAALSHVSRFLSDYRLSGGTFTFTQARRVAFFPGTFDPFTLSHKGIVHAIRDLGFEVYLAVDEFSWSKKAQPHLIRRQIVNLSVAGEFHVHLFPDDIPVNIANPRDLKRLVSLFPGQEVYIVAGSDVVANASSYRMPPEPWSIHQMNHVIFRREDAPLENLPIRGKVIQLQLPPHLEDISSSRIRENVDQNRDISSYIDPVIQDFIYQNGLYLRDSQEKVMLVRGAEEFIWLDTPSTQDVNAVTAGLPEGAVLAESIIRQGDKVLVLKREGRTLGFASCRRLTASRLYRALGDHELTNRIRLRSGGQILLISALEVFEGEDSAQLMLTEVLARALEQEAVYAVFRPCTGRLDPAVDDILSRMGFVALEGSEPVREVDMHAPTIMIQNLEHTIQKPLCSSPKVLEAVRRGRERVQRAMTGLYPGSLVLLLSAEIIHHRLLDKITGCNNVPSTPTHPRVLGESMCVPFGKLLRGNIVPNTVTKTIHTDKVYSPDLQEYTIDAFPNYASLPNQVRMIKSFNRPVILVDDVMHPGFRMRHLGPILQQEGVSVRMVLVGVLSGYGKDLMRSWEQPVDCVYYLPSLRQWFVESTLYPFIGGNTVRRNRQPVPGLLPGINHILPYAAPVWQEECGRAAAVRLSRACLEADLDIIRVLEREYRILYGRNLTLSRLPEAVVLPLCPDKGTCLSYDPSLAASVYLENDLEQLLRQNPQQAPEPLR